MLTPQQFDGLVQAGYTHIPVFRQRLAELYALLSDIARTAGQLPEAEAAIQRSIASPTVITVGPVEATYHPIRLT